MLLLPYRAQIKLHKVPVATLAVAAVCLLIYFFQDRNEERIEAHAKNVCAQLAESNKTAAQGYRWWKYWKFSCDEAIIHIYFSPDPEKHLAWHVEDMKQAGDVAGAERLPIQYHAFAQYAPALLTAKLWHDRSRFDPIGMLTCSFAHGSWDHVIFNLIFFFAFAAGVELVLGPVLFLATIVALSYGIGFFDAFLSRWVVDPGPTLGLSGDVMGILALFIYFLPRAKIRFFFWFVLSIGTIGIPAWLVGVWYIGWNLFDQFLTPHGYINFVGHLAGAAFGFLIGLLVFSGKRAWAKDIIEERVDLTQDEGRLSTLNGLMVGPAVAGFAFLAGIFLLLVVIVLVQHYWVPMLLAAPAIAAAYHLYSSRNAGRPLRERYQLGVAALERREYDEALKYLLPLADKNDARALFALGELHATANGAMRDEAKAVALFSRAAERGHALAQYALGIRYADGRGIPRNTPKAIECYESAAQSGVPDAANSLGYLYEHGNGVPADREKAIGWYYRAAVAYQRAKRPGDAEAVLRHLRGLAGQGHAILASIEELDALIAGQRPSSTRPA